MKLTYALLRKPRMHNLRHVVRALLMKLAPDWFGLNRHRCNRESPAQFDNRLRPRVYIRRITRRTMYSTKKLHFHTGQCKRTGCCYNELVVSFFRTGDGLKGKNLYLLTLWFIYKLASILFVITPGAQTIGNIAVYGSAKQLVI